MAFVLPVGEACPIDTYNGFSENVTRDKHDENVDCVTCPVGQITDGKTASPYCSPCAAGRHLITETKLCAASAATTSHKFWVRLILQKTKLG